MSRYLAGTLVLLATAALAAPAHGQVTTHAQYVDEVNPICKDFRGDAKRAQKKAGGRGDPTTVFIRKTVAFQRVFKRTVNRIADVERPAETAEDITRWVKGLKQQKRLIDRFIAAAKRRQALRSVQLGKRVAKVEGRNGNRAKRLDLDRCAG
jgi:hypothetical protein